MHLRLQEPNSGRLLEALAEAAAAADCGTAVFSFASLGGCRLFMEEDSIHQLAADRTLDLIVGVDAVTTVEALEYLLECSTQLAGLNVRAFLHTNARSLFHPKFGLFCSGDSGTLIAGSGNLTAAGLGRIEPAGTLGGNWEAFTVTELEGADLQEVRDQYVAWRKHQTSEGLLRSLEDPGVLARAIENARIGWSRPKAPQAGDVGAETAESPAAKGETETSESPEAEKGATHQLLGDTPAFVCEIPSGSTRWGQANFHLEEFEGYFGFEGRVGESAEIVIQSVRPDGSLGDPERRPPVRVKSRNFRIELGAAQEFAYEKTKDDDRPVAVFVRVGNRAFRYCLLVPSDPEYASVLALLPPKGSGRRLMRSSTMDAQVVKDAWHSAPDRLFPENRELPEI